VGGWVQCQCGCGCGCGCGFGVGCGDLPPAGAKEGGRWVGCGSVSAGFGVVRMQA